MRFVSIFSACALFAASCADQDVTRDVSAAPRGGSPTAEPGSDAAGSGSGAATTESGGAPENAGSGALAEAGEPPSAADPDPQANPVVDDPPLDDPPIVDDPPVDDPPVDDRPVDDPPVDDPPTDDPPPHPDDDVRLPCDVQRLLRARCQSCHASSPIGGASISLVSYADLTAPSRVVATASVVARSVQRMSDALSPMPPPPATRATPAEIATLQAWLNAGPPPGSCDDESGPPTNPYDAQPTCSSSSYWTAYDSGSPWMNPGLACLKCHRQYPNFAPRFTLAGTVFPTAHEPDKCFGVPASAGADIIITDANGQQLPPIHVVSGGNFGAIIADLAMPYRAKVVVGDSERIMVTPQTNGDCNACHSQSGTEGAPGRIIVP